MIEPPPPAPGAEGTPDDAAALLAAWQAGGLAAHDPVRWRFLEALCRRLQRSQGAARQPLAQRLQQAMGAYAVSASASSRAAVPAPLPTSDPTSTGPGPLAGLLAHIATQSAGTAPTAATAATEAGGAELKALQYFRSTWSRLSADQRLQQSLAEVPDNAGPLNSQQLVHRALALMRAVSPAYLQHFVAQVDTLLWLERMEAGDLPGARADGTARKPGRGARRPR